NFEFRDCLGGRSHFLVKYSVTLNRIAITIYNTLIDTRADAYLIVNLSFARKQRKLLKLPIYNDFDPGYVTPYKKAKFDSIEIALKGYLKIQNYKLLD
ncbi:hypothetical protein QBC32DRAFT_225137, partial [Pseudoneurospora amorphoporcata]